MFSDWENIITWPKQIHSPHYCSNLKREKLHKPTFQIFCFIPLFDLKWKWNYICKDVWCLSYVTEIHNFRVISWWAKIIILRHFRGKWTKTFETIVWKKLSRFENFFPSSTESRVVVKVLHNTSSKWNTQVYTCQCLAVKQHCGILT